MDGASTQELIENAVDFLNATVWGTLSVTFVVDEKRLEPTVENALERAIEDPRYGTVALNGPGVLAFATMIAPWGGVSGSSTEDIQSGTCKSTNMLRLHHPQKNVVRAPFNWWPYPFLGMAIDLHRFCRMLSLFEATPSLMKLPGLFWGALRASVCRAILCIVANVTSEKPHTEIARCNCIRPLRVTL